MALNHTNRSNKKSPEFILWGHLKSIHWLDGLTDRPRALRGPKQKYFTVSAHFDLLVALQGKSQGMTQVKFNRGNRRDSEVSWKDASFGLTTPTSSAFSPNAAQHASSESMTHVGGSVVLWGRSSAGGSGGLRRGKCKESTDADPELPRNGSEKLLESSQTNGQFVATRQKLEEHRDVQS